MADSCLPYLAYFSLPVTNVGSVQLKVLLKVEFLDMQYMD